MLTSGLGGLGGGSVITLAPLSVVVGGHSDRGLLLGICGINYKCYLISVGVFV